MTFVADKLTLKTAIEALGYKEVKQLASKSASQADKYYSIKPVSYDVKGITNSGEMHEANAELEVTFLCMSETDYDTAFDSFGTLLESIKGLHYGYKESPSFTRQEKKAVGKAILNTGVRQC